MTAIIFLLIFSSVFYLLEDSYSPTMGLVKNLAHSRNSVKFAKQVKYSASMHFSIFNYRNRDNNSITNVDMVVKINKYYL